VLAALVAGALRAVGDEAPARLTTIAATTVAEGKNMGAVPTEKAD
jgi:hypothetical protein